MWRRDYGYEDDHSTHEVRTVYVVGGGPQDMYSGGPSRQPSLSFSPTELQHLAMAIGVLSLAFAIVLSSVLYNQDYNRFIFMLIISFIIVSTGFALHEIGHKYMAQRYGHWAEFRYSAMGLFIALIISAFGWIVAAPGAVYIRGNVTEEENGKISAMGPWVNIGLTPLFWGIVFMAVILNSEFLVNLGVIGAILNPIIAGFNMIPLYPLDGSKIWKWNPAHYIFMVLIIGALLVAAFMVFYL
ncbi:MAG: metalloprotease [Thermoplasmata archaeon]|nr:MAG: metalloprotease [Thermoplasmata archaeon]